MTDSTLNVETLARRLAKVERENRRMRCRRHRDAGARLLTAHRGDENAHIDRDAR